MADAKKSESFAELLAEVNLRKVKRMKTMNEMLCRGKRIDNGKWIEGYYARCKSSLEQRDASMITEKTIIIEKDATISRHGEILDYIEVIPETVSRCTGYMDFAKNLMIFQGDIFKEPKNGDVVCVVFADGGFEFHDVSGFRYRLEDYNHFFRHIGNIHDNPELMKAGVANG